MKETPEAGNSLSQIAVQLRAIETLIPFNRNARVHSDEAISRLISIIETLGWTNPILADGDGIVAGHKRHLAALAIYGKGGTIRLPNGHPLEPGFVPVIDVSGWSEEQRRAYVLADNQTTLESHWDGDLLRLELEWLSETGIDMGLTGFDGDALAAALAPPVSETPEESILRVSLSDRFGVPPFSVLSARDGWWQDRKRAWLRLGIMSELGRGEGEHNAAPSGSPRPLDRRNRRIAPGGSPRPATNYSKSKARGDGKGKVIAHG